MPHSGARALKERTVKTAGSTPGALLFQVTGAALPLCFCAVAPQLRQAPRPASVGRSSSVLTARPFRARWGRKKMPPAVSVAAGG